MQTSPSLRRAAVAASALTVLLFAGCATESPSGHSLRLEKAAGLKSFQIDTTEALWKATSKQTGWVEEGRRITAKVTKLDNGLVHVEMTGVSLANYLRLLDHDAHGGMGSAPFERTRKAESIRMYDEIAKKLDAVEARPAPGAPPLKIVVDDAFVDKNGKKG